MKPAVQAALRAVDQGATVNTAATHWNVAPSTLHYHLRQRKRRAAMNCHICQQSLQGHSIAADNPCRARP